MKLTKEIQLDVSGIPCPMPLLKLKKIMAEHFNEEISIMLTVTDKGALKDIPAFCHQQNIDCQLEAESPNGVFRFKLLKEAK